MVSCVKHVCVPVADQARALKFYTEQLGLVVSTDVDCGDGQRWIELDLPDGNTHVVLSGDKDQQDRVGTMQNIIFASQNIAEDYKKLKQKGVQFTQELVEESWGTYAIFKDSENNLFVLSETD